MRYPTSKPRPSTTAVAALGRGLLIGACTTLLQLVSIAAALIYAGVLDL